LRLKKNMSSKRSESSNMNIIREGNLKTQTGSKKSREKSRESSRKTRPWTTPERRESNNSTPCRSYNA
jgi:hypothetical protein